MTYTAIEHMVPIINKVTTFSSQAKYDSIQQTFEELFTALLAHHQNPDDAILAYNVALSSLEGVSSKDHYNNIIARHSRVLRNYCNKQRDTSLLTPSEITRLTHEHLVSKQPLDAIKIAGVRKTIRISANVGILTPTLSGKEPEYAAAAGCSWSAISSWQVIDAGFMCTYGRKFDTQKTLSIIDMQAAHKPGGITPAEFQSICKNMVDCCIQRYGLTTTQNLVTKAVSTTLDKITAKAGEQGFLKIKEFAKEFNLNIPANNDLSKLLPFILISPNNVFGPVCPQGANIEYGLTLLYPVAPLFSREWITAVNDIVSGEFRIGFVDNHALHYAQYDCSHGIQTRLFPYASCSFLIGSDQGLSETIAASSKSKILPIAYQWDAVDTNSRLKLGFSLDDLMLQKVFPVTGTFVLKPRAVSLNNQPRLAHYGEATSDIKAVGFPDGVNVNDIIVVINHDSSGQDKAPVWGIPLENIESILPFLDFLPGQEQDKQQDFILCRVSAESNNAVTNAILSKTNKKCLLIKTKDVWCG